MQPAVAATVSAAAVAAIAIYIVTGRRRRQQALAGGSNSSRALEDSAVAEWRSLPEPQVEIDEAARDQIIAGLLRKPRARISQEYLYDDAGSQLYEGITRTPEYYLTSKEAALLTECAEEMGRPATASSSSSASPVPLPLTQVAIELGAGEGIKTLLLLRALVPNARRTVYAPIDISSEALESNAQTVAHLKLETRPCHGRFEECLPEAASYGGARLFLFLGSSLGNYNDEEAVELLGLVAAQMSGPYDRFLVGVDTPHSAKKPASKIHAAYNDAAGFTAAFTLNGLRHANRVAGLDFRWRGDGWAHVAEYREHERAIVTHVEAVGEQVVRDLTKPGHPVLRTFRGGERIFMEQSRKFDLCAITALAARAGLAVSRSWQSADDHHLIAELIRRPAALPYAVYAPASPHTPANGVNNGHGGGPHALPVRGASSSMPPVASSAVMLASLTAHTGNAVTSARILSALPASSKVLADVASFADGAALGEHLVAHGATLVVGVHAYRAGRLLVDCGVPFVLILGGTDMNEHLAQPEKGAVIRAAIAQSAAVVAFDANLMARLLVADPSAKHKAFLVPQAVDVSPCAAVADPRAAARAALGVPADATLLLLPAGLRPVKDVLYGLAAIAAWHRRDPRVHLRIVGPELEQAYAADVKRALASCGAAHGAVTYVGALPRAALHDAMRAADVVLNTSRTEGMCNSILEAMLVGTPVVARSNAGNQMLIEHGATGLLFESPEELVEAASKLLSDDALTRRITDAATARVARAHSTDAEARGYAEAARFAVAARGPPQRDHFFLGYHAPHHARPELSDLYATLDEKTFAADAEWLLAEMRSAHALFMRACPDEHALDRRPGLNPVTWTIGHVAFTYDSIVAYPLRLPTPGSLRFPASKAGTAPLPRANAWSVLDSMRVNGAERWARYTAGELPETGTYLELVHRTVEGAVRASASAGGHGAPGAVHPAVTYLVLYATIHELWHTEDLVHTRNVHAMPPPKAVVSMTAKATVAAARSTDRGGGTSAPTVDDVSIPGGRFFVGAERHLGGGAGGEAPLVFDCEKWAHAVDIEPFQIGRVCVTNAEFAAFVDGGGYEDESHWGFEGVRWLRKSGARHPRTWRRASAQGAHKGASDVGGGRNGSGGTWSIQWFEQEVPLAEAASRPVCHVNWYEAEAYCAWAGRRLPTEAEWEVACCGVPAGDGSLAPHKARRLPWGDGVPVDSERANAGLRCFELLDVDALPDSDSAWGCRQMVGNVWEWTATTFYPYPGYVPDYPYREQSAPWFGVNKVARGGCFATPDLLLNLRGGEYRSFYHPSDRPELAVGFRTCALRAGGGLTVGGATRRAEEPACLTCMSDGGDGPRESCNA